MFKVYIEHYDRDEQKMIKESGFVSAENYMGALEKIVQYYGDEDIECVRLDAFSPDSMLMFDVDNGYEKALFNSVDSILADKVVW